MSRYNSSNDASQEGFLGDFFATIGQIQHEYKRGKVIDKIFSDPTKVPALNGIPVRNYRELTERLKQFINRNEEWDLSFFTAERKIVYIKQPIRDGEFVSEQALGSVGCGFLIGKGREFKYRYYEENTKLANAFIDILRNDLNLSAVH